MGPADLPTLYRQKATELAHYLVPADVAWTQAAELAEAALAANEHEPLSLAVAELESGYTTDHLRRLLREGTIPNAGTPAEPRIQRRHLPRKPGYGVVANDTVAPKRSIGQSRSAVARAVADRE